MNKDIKLMQVLSEEMKEKLLELAEKGLDVNQILKELLTQRESAIKQKMTELSQKQAVKETVKTPARHIPAAIRKNIKEKYGAKCSAPNCIHPATQFHHQKPFARFKTHDPVHIKPLCRGHHELQHK